MPTAAPDDVRIEIETTLDDTMIEKIIARVSRDIDRDDGIGGLDEQDRQDLEAVLAAHHIATTTSDRAESDVQTGRTSVTYEESLVDELKARARRLGATDELLGIGATNRTASIGVPKTRD